MADEEERDEPPARPEPSPAGRRGRGRIRVRWWAVGPIVVVVLLAGEAGARFIGPSIPRTAGSEERMLIKADQIFDRGTSATDVVVIGSSESAGGLAPATIDAQVPGLHGVYNAALVGPTMTLTRDWVRRVVVPHLKPKVAVIGMLPLSVLDEAFVARTSGLDEQRQAIAAYRSALDQVDPGGMRGLGWELRQRSALIRYRPYLRSPTLVARGLATALRGGPEPVPDAPDPAFDWLTETDPARVEANTGSTGQIYDYLRPSAPVTADAIGARLYELFGTAGTDFTQLAALVDWLEARGVTPVIAIAPVDRAPLIGGGADLAPLDRVAAEIERWGAARGIPVNDQFTEAWDSALFHDRNHLDERGAEAWSAVVGRWLGDLCDAGDLEGCATR